MQSLSSPAVSNVKPVPKHPFAPDEPPRQPDWLLIMVGILFTLTLLLAWLVVAP